VTLTITEKGYSPGAGLLERDLANPRRPRTAIAYLAAGLRGRRAAGAPGLTLLSCDNLRSNGRQLRSAVLAFATSLEPGLSDWIESRCRFPCTMVDRIVPASGEDDYREVARALELEDRAAVCTEPFSQWVIESNFAGPVPPWNEVGASYVEDVAPFETMKLRLLNASHSCLAYLGCLACRHTVVEALAAPGMEALLRQLMLKEMAPGLSGLGDFDLPAYCEALLERFDNPGLAHTTAQIAMDGSRKIPQRLLPPLRDQVSRGQPGEATALAIAAWLHYLRGLDDRDGVLAISDPMANTFAQLAARHGGDLEAYLDAVMGLDGLFGEVLRGAPQVRQALLRWLRLLDERGADAVVARWADARR
jgi:fructuronate reductase